MSAQRVTSASAASMRCLLEQHQVKLVDPRYEEFSTTVELKEGKTTKLAETLKPLPLPKGPFGALRTPVPEKYAAVYINDKFYGHAGEFNNSSQKLMLPVGEYSVRVEPLERRAHQSEGQDRGREDRPRTLSKETFRATIQTRCG